MKNKKKSTKSKVNNNKSKTNNKSKKKQSKLNISKNTNIHVGSSFESFMQDLESTKEEFDDKKFTMEKCGCTPEKECVEDLRISEKTTVWQKIKKYLGF